LNGILFSTVPRTLDSRHLPQLRNSPYTTGRAAIHHGHRMVMALPMPVMVRDGGGRLMTRVCATAAVQLDPNVISRV